MKNQVKGFKKKTTSLEDLPTHGPMKRADHAGWRRWYRWRRKYDGARMSTHIDRFLKNSIGKDFDTEYSKFCGRWSKHPEMKKNLMEEFYPKYGRMRYNEPERWDRYIIDDKGKVQLIKGTDSLEKDTYTIKSHDYKSERRHKISGEVYVELPWYARKKIKEEDYEWVTIQGFCKTFTSKEHPEYCRLYYEKVAQEKKRRRENKKAKADRSYSFLTKLEQAIKDGKIKNQVDMERHGFSEESFHGEEYHGRKNKKKRFKLAA